MLVDGHAMVFRAYHAMARQNLINSAGMPVGAVFGFYRMLAKLIKDHSPDYFLLIFDPPGENFRNRIYPKYKANRPEAPEDFKIQMSEILEIAQTINIPVFIPDDAEADDAIASIVEKHKNSGLEMNIVSGDKDLYSLLHKNIKILKAKRGVSEFIEIDSDFVQQEWDIHYTQTTDFLAISGDTADNIPGVRGVGYKGAGKLLNQYDNLEKIYKNIDKIQPDGIKKKLIESKENAFLSQKLVQLKKDISFDKSFEELDTNTFLREKASLFTIFKEKELNVVYQDWQKITDADNIKESNIGKNTRIIRSQKEWEEIYSIIIKSKFVALDTETTDKFPIKAKLLGISIAWEQQQNKGDLPPKLQKQEDKEYYSVYIPCVFIPLGNEDNNIPKGGSEDLFSSLNTAHSDYRNILPGSKVLGWVTPLLEDESIKKVGQNIKYDWLVLKKHGINLKGMVADTMLLSFLLKPGRRRHNLDNMALDYLGHTTIKYSDLVGTGKKQKPLISVSLDELAAYACEDVEVTLRLYEILREKVTQENFMKINNDIDLPLVYVLMIMEENGIVLDTPYLSKLADRYQKELKKIEKNIFEMAEEEFNIQSPLELRRILFEKLGIKSDKKTGKGQLSTDHSVLERLKDKHPIITHLLKFRLLSKLLSTYILPLPQAVQENTQRVHTSFAQVIAVTARLASMEPNLQNIPIKGKEGHEIRKAFVSAPNYELLSLDYSQIELRILAHYSKDKNLKKAYDEDEDIHDQAAYLLFHHYFNKQNKTWNFAPVSQSDSSQETLDIFSNINYDDQLDIAKLNLMKETPEFQNCRAQAKILNFSIIYGVTDWGLSQHLNISREEAKALIQAYLITYPGIKEYMQHIVETTREKGYSENLFGRKRAIHDLNHQNHFKREAAERLAMNTPIQSTAADIIKIAMINIQKELESQNAKSKMLLQIHDELLFEVELSEKNEMYKMIKDKMENSVQLNVPLKVSGGFGKNWDEAK